MNVSIARISHTVASCNWATTGDQRRLRIYPGDPASALADGRKDFEDEGSRDPRNRSLERDEVTGWTAETWLGVENEDWRSEPCESTLNAGHLTTRGSGLRYPINPAVQDMENPFFDDPILNSPYAFPSRHWELDEAGQPTQQIIETRRGAEFITPIPKPRQRGRALGGR